MATVLILLTTFMFDYTIAMQYIDHITTPTRLNRGDYIISKSSHTRLTMQSSDGNFVLYNGTTDPWKWNAIWSANTINATYTQITDDGNIMTKDDDGTVYWSSDSGGHNASEYHLVVMDSCAYLMDTHYNLLWSTCQNDCNVMYPTFASPTYAGDTPVPTAQPTFAPTHLNHVVIPSNSSYRLYADESIWSLSMTTVFIMQLDGNIVLYHYDQCQFEVLWRSNSQTSEHKVEYLEMNSDGNIVATDSNNTIYWQSNSGGHLASAPHRFVVIADCAYVADKYYSVLWSVGNCNCSDPVFDPPTVALSSPTGAPTLKPTPFYMDHVSTPSNGSFFLYPSERISSLSLTTYATFQTDGNFVLYKDEGCRHTPLFSTKTGSSRKSSAKYLELKRTGSMRVVGIDGTELWKSFTGGRVKQAPHHLAVTDECIYLMDRFYDVYWSEGDGCNGNYPTFSSPTVAPTVPTTHPTTAEPTYLPTTGPTMEPTTVAPTEITLAPTIFPSKQPTKAPTNTPTTDEPTQHSTESTVYEESQETESEDVTDDDHDIGNTKEDTTSTWFWIILIVLGLVVFIALVIGLVCFAQHRSQRRSIVHEPRTIIHLQNHPQNITSNVVVASTKMNSMTASDASHDASEGIMEMHVELEDSVALEGEQRTVEGPEGNMQGIVHETAGNDHDNVQADEFIVVGDDEMSQQYATIQ